MSIFPVQWNFAFCKVLESYTNLTSIDVDGVPGAGFVYVVFLIY